MKKCLLRALSAALILLLPCCALAEGAPAFPALTAEPAGTEFSCEAFIVRLPAGLEPMDEAQLAGYDAAVQFDFPDTAQTLLAAADAQRGAALCFALRESAQLPLEAAQEAAASILGSPDNARELRFGENSGAGFAVAVEDSAYCIYFFSNGSQLLLVTLGGLTDEESASMLSTLDL